jgi:hypothetical protein
VSDRSQQIGAVISVASLVSHSDPAEALAVLIGAVTLMCARSKDPIATLQISIDSISTARDICVARLRPAAPEGQLS